MFQIRVNSEYFPWRGKWLIYLICTRLDCFYYFFFFWWKILTKIWEYHISFMWFTDKRATTNMPSRNGPPQMGWPKRIVRHCLQHDKKSNLIQNISLKILWINPLYIEIYYNLKGKNVYFSSQLFFSSYVV